MNERQRRAITWHKIERLAFWPSDRDKDRWLSIYGRSLAELWDVQRTDVCVRANGFDAVFLNITCEYEVVEPDKYSVRIINAHDKKTAWSLHVDPSYYSKSFLLGPPKNAYPRQQVKADLKGDVSAVLSGMLFHPRNHCHGDDLELEMKLANAALGPHEFRVGSGIENAFVFLAHLRYQLLLLNTGLRNKERDRLIELFTTAIRERKTHVPPSETLDLQR